MFVALKPTNEDYLTFTRDGIDFSVTGFRYDQTKEWFECQVHAEKDGVALPLDNPYRFINPPTQGDLNEALQVIVRDAVLVVAKGRGWQP